MTTTYRLEKDFLGNKKVPHDAYYGIQTLRAKENFSITGMRIGQFTHFVVALAQVKKAAALANMQAGDLNSTIGNAIVRAADEVIDGHFFKEFVVDPMQGGAGTSSNMNINEVLANRALEMLGHKKGNYGKVSANNHVNMSQSTNDTYPTALRLATCAYLGDLSHAIQYLKKALLKKATEFDCVIKVGRTQLQDAVPMTLGQEFRAFANTISEDTSRLQEVQTLLLEVNLGATAIGTGINASVSYRTHVIEALREVTGKNIVIAEDLVEATSDTGALVLTSGLMRRIAIKLNKIANDLRLLTSGPSAGLGEIRLPMMQPGSSIMPGKVNPVIPELINQIAYEVMGNDVTISIAASNAQLQLNAFEPVMAFGLYRNAIMLSRGIKTLVRRCIIGIEANTQRCKNGVLKSNVLATALTPYLGYERTSLLVKESERTGVPVYTLALEQNLITHDTLDSILHNYALPTTLP